MELDRAIIVSFFQWRGVSEIKFVCMVDWAKGTLIFDDSTVWDVKHFSFFQNSSKFWNQVLLNRNMDMIVLKINIIYNYLQVCNDKMII